MKKNKIIEFSHCLFIKMEVENDENLLENACTELGITDFERYEACWGADFAFLCEKSELKNCDNAYPEALLYRHLSRFKLGEKYAVLVLKNDYAFTAFFDEQRLIYCRQAAHFGRKNLLDLNERQTLIDDFLNEHLIQALKDYESEVLVVVNDDVDLTNALKYNVSLPIYHSKDLFKGALIRFEKKQGTTNFLRKQSSDEDLLKRLMMGFCGAFLLCVFAVFGDYFYEHYRLKSLLDSQNVDVSVKKTHAKNAKIIAEKSEIIERAKAEFSPLLLVEMFERLFFRMSESKAMAQSIEFRDNSIKLTLQNTQNNTLFVNKIHENTEFSVISKETNGDFLYVILEIK